MNTYPYVRPHLTASQNRVADPALLTDLWLDQFLALHETDALDASNGAYDFLALYGRLLRTRHDLLAATGRLDEWEAVRRVVVEQASTLLERALTLPNPAAWLVETRQFEEAFDSAIDHAELAVWAERLLADLDDAGLVAWAACHFAAADDELETQLHECEVWLEANADLFLPCAVFVQAVGQTLRPDLSDTDWNLAQTADKFVILLDEQEAAEERLNSTSGVTFDPGALLELFRLPATVYVKIAPVPDLAVDWGWLPERRLLAAATGPTAIVHHRDWVSPDGQYRATLAAGPENTDDVRINFYRDRESARDLAGQPVLLAGVPAVVDAGGNADFDLASLRRARQEGRALTLQVGDGMVLWKLMSHRERGP